MATQTSPTTPSISSDYIIKTLDNLSQQYDRADESALSDITGDTVKPGIQVPVILNIKGPLSLRGKQEPYKVTKG
tara:strand:+ start:351 stop:575 length:225 start_codon:yes stop_codon:yes gene_type:complete